MEWIRVKDEEPNDERFVLCYSPIHKEIFIGNYTPTYGHWCSNDYDHGECTKDYEVTHWTPLPEPPKQM